MTPLRRAIEGMVDIELSRLAQMRDPQIGSHRPTRSAGHTLSMKP